MGRDLQGVLDALLDGVVVVDRAGRVELLNAEASRILETSAKATSGQPLERVIGADHPVVVLTRAVLDEGRPSIRDEFAIKRRFAEDAVVDAAASPLFEGDGPPSGVVLVLRDRTIQNALRDLVSERERLDSFGQMAAGIAHEVKNPLGGIRGAGEILASRASDAKTRDAAELIVREVDRIASLVDDLMVFARGEELRLDPVNIHRVLHDVLDVLATDPVASGAQLERRFDPSIPEFLADADRLTQVFLNLARNGLQAMAEAGGTLVITTRMTLDHRLSTPSEGQLSTVVVEIADDGPGIEPETLGKLSTPFFTTRRGGTGLGLAVSRHWVTRHGGTLRIDSQPGEGTRVRVALPLRRPS